MKKLFFVFVVLFCYVGEVSAVEYRDYSFVFEDGDTREQVYQVLEKYSDDALFVWNTFTRQLVDIDAESACLHLD